MVDLREGSLPPVNQHVENVQGLFEVQELLVLQQVTEERDDGLVDG